MLIFPDGVTADDRVNAAVMSRYSTVVLPDCPYLTTGQADALLGHLDSGGTVVVSGALGENLPPEVQEKLRSHPSARAGHHHDVEGLLPQGRQVASTGFVDVSVNLHRLEGGSAALHLVNYGYEPETDAVRVLRDVTLDVRLPMVPSGATAVCPSGSKPVPIATGDGRVRLSLSELPLYSVVVLHAGDQASTADPLQEIEGDL